MKKFPLLLIPAMLLVGAGCVSTKSTTTSTAPATPAAQPTTSTAPSGAAQESVAISGYAFQVPSLTVKVGTTVTWTNNDAMDHTVTADDGSFDSGNVGTGATYSRTFTQAGTYPYRCTFHPSMHGTVIVQ